MIINNVLITQHDRKICELLNISEEQYNRFCSNLVFDQHGCLVWVGPILPTTGYGRFLWGTHRVGAPGNCIGAHRLVMMFYLGRLLDKDELVCHICPQHNLLCCSHTYLGDHISNMKDRANDGNYKQKTGSDSPFAKHKQEDIEQMRSLYRTGNYTQDQLAKMFNCSSSSISRIVRYKTY